MSNTTEALAFVPEQKGPGGAGQNLPTDRTAAPGRAIPAAAPQQADSPAVISAATGRQAAALGLAVLAEARWPESVHDHTAPSLPGFIVSTFSPIAAETACRCLGRRAAAGLGAPETSEAPVTAVIITTARGDRESAGHVARTVAAGGLLGPLLFFQSVPNAVAGHIAARWKLTGPVVCLADPDSALESAALLIEDGDADEVLLVRIEQGQSQSQGQGQSQSGSPGQDQAHAVLLGALILDDAPTPAPTTPGARP